MRGRGRHRIGLTALAVSLALVTSSCGVFGGDKEVVRVYSGRHYDLERAFEQFSKETGISVEFLYGSDVELRERIRVEGRSTLADVYMTVDAANLVLGARDGIFRPLRSPALEAAVPQNLRDPEGRWFGLSQRARTIMYAPDRVRPEELSTYEDLADPKWRGRLCLRPSGAGYTQSLVAGLIAHLGYDRALDVVRGWVANRPRMISNDVEILRTIAAGGCDVGITNHYYLARLIEDDRDFAVRPFWVDQQGRGVHVNISGAGVIRNADHPVLARRLLEWLATTGQRAFVEGNHEYPVNASVQPDALLRGFGTFRSDTLSATVLGETNAQAVRLMEEAEYE